MPTLHELSMINYPHVKQIVRVTRHCMDKKTEKESIESAFGLTSTDAGRATPQDRLAWNRGHWLAESHHHVGDVTFKKTIAPPAPDTYPPAAPSSTLS